jgi:lipopolysaccharide exporter
MKLLSSIKNLWTHLLHGPLRADSFLRNVLTIFAGTVLSQAIAIAVIPILTRIYSPQDFGTLATFITFCSVMAIAASFSYQGAVILPKRNESAFGIWISSIAISLIVSLVTGFGLFFLAPEISQWLDNPELESWLWLVPLEIWATAGFAATSIWATRHKQYSDMSKGMIMTRFPTAAAQLGMSRVSVSATSLIIGQVTGSVTGFIYLLFKSLKDVPRHYWKTLSIKRIRILLHRYRRFPAYDLLSSVAAAISRNLPIIALGYFFNPAAVGFFAVAYRMVGGPLQLGTASITQVFFHRSNQARHAGDLDKITVQAFDRLTAIFMAPLVLLCIAAPEITVILLGDQWAEAGIFLRWLVPWFFFVSIASPLHRLFAVLERQSELAVINSLLFLFSAGALIAGGMTGEPVYAVALFSICSSVVWIGQGIRLLVIAGAKTSDYFGTLFNEAIAMLPYAVLMSVARLLTENQLIITAVFSILMGVFALRRAKYVFGKK